MATHNACIHCGTNISLRAKRCKSCSTEYQWAQPGSTIRQATNSLECRAKRSAQLRAQWANPNSAMRRSHNSLEYKAKHKRAVNTPEFKAKVSAQARARWTQPEYRAKMLARIHAQWADSNSALRQSISSSEVRAKMSASAISAWNNDSQYRRNHLAGFAERERRKASNVELRVKAFLDANFAGVIHQYVPDEDMSPGVYDFYIPGIDTIVEVDEHYWHTLDDVQKKDLRKEEFALEHEYGFVRITEFQAKSSKYLKSLLKELLAEEF